MVPSSVSNSGHGMQSKTEQEMHGQNMKQGRADRDKLDSRASICNSWPEQTNYKAVQSMQFRTSQDKAHYMNRTVQGQWCRMGTVSAD